MTSSYTISSWLFGRALGLVLLIAFVSLGVQAQGLFGSSGVMPVHLFVESAKGAGHGVLQHPSLLWWSSTDGMILAVWLGGAVAAALLMLGVLPKAMLAFCWLAYLSFFSVGWPFMSFQWDTLLLETCFTAFFFVPWRAWDRPGSHPEPHLVARWAIWWLLVRLIFRSAYVKIASGDAAWADLSALSYHYFTQPLPNPVSWYANLLPAWAQKLSCLGMFVIELGAPLLIVVPRAWARRVAALCIATLMGLIALTGNYGFFNLLTAVLCIPLLDDELLRRARSGSFSAMPSKERRSRWNTWPNAAPALVIALTAVIFFAGTFAGGPPRWLAPVYRFGSFNNYGLFAVMTTERPEIEIEGSADGKTWIPYQLAFKPGPLDRAPAWVAPHQPRIDWQMWFAALGDYRRNVWLGNLMRRLLEGEPSVLALVGHNPFEDEPPKQVRAILYSYELTSWEERAASGNWWKRGEPALYAPILGVPVEPASTAE